MPFNPKTWEDRVAEFPNRRRLDSTGITDTYDVARSEGAVSVEGDKINAANLNNLEGRISAAFTEQAEGLVTPAEKTAWDAGIVSTYIHTKTGTVHNLAGTGNNIEFLAKFAIADGDTWTVNGVAVTATMQNGDPLPADLFKSGSWVTGVRLDGAKLNFKSGGGSYGTLAAQITNFYATIGNASVALSWLNPTDTNFVGVAIVRKTGSYPTKVSDGTKIYEGSLQAFSDTGLTNGTQYYYRAFAYNAKKEYQTQYCVATMTPQNGNPLSVLPVGAKIKFGTFLGAQIIQTVMYKSGNDVTLISDAIIAQYAFDAKESLNSNTSRQNYGNNRYMYSNIHQWLNSAAAAGAWYTAKHSADQAPSSTPDVTTHPYSANAGFLNEFTIKEQNYLKTKSITVGKAAIDGGGTEAIDAKVWLPSGTEVGLSTGFTEGTQSALFSSNADRIAKYSGTANYYWLRSPYSDPGYTNAVTNLGSLSYEYCNDGGYGVRPCCMLDSSVLVSLTPDGNGYYSVL